MQVLIIENTNKPKNCFKCNYNQSDCYCGITKKEIDRDDGTCLGPCPMHIINIPQDILESLIATYSTKG